MGAWSLPTYCLAGGKKWEMNTDYRAALDIFRYFNDPEYELDEQWEICLSILYKDYDVDNPPPDEVTQELASFAADFLEAGIEPENGNGKKPRLMDWEQDAPIMAAPISAQLGRDVRDPAPLHFWTFISAYLGISPDCFYSEVISVRHKKAKGKKLEKYEEEFYRANKSIIDLKSKGTKARRSEEEENEIRALFGLRPKK